MSTTPPPTSRSSTAIVIAVTVGFVVTVAAATGIAIAIEDGARAASMVGLVVSPFASLIGILTIIVKFGTLDTKVDAVHQNTHELTNGLMDQKIATALANMVKPELLNPRALAAAETATRLLEPRVNETGDPR